MRSLAKRFEDLRQAATNVVRAEPPSPQAPTWVSDVEYLDSWPDPFFALLKATADPGHQNSTLIGLTQNENFLFGAPRRQTLILGPTQSNKTTGTEVPAALAHFGPVVFLSTKRDPIPWSAIVRARHGGRLWHYNPDGSSPAPGLTPLRYSLIDVARNDVLGLMAGRALVKGSTVGGDQHQFWRDHGGDFVGNFLFAANVGQQAGMKEADIAWVLAGVEGNKAVVDQAEEWLERSGRSDAIQVAERIRAKEHLAPEQLSSIRISAQHAMRVYGDDASRKQTEDPNFDPAAFVAGEPEWFNPWAAGDDNSFTLAKVGIHGDFHGPLGRFDTIFITTSHRTQERAPAAIVALLSLIEDAAYEQAAVDVANGVSGRPPVLLVLDELAGLAHDPDYGEILREGGSQGVMVISALQDLGQAAAQWDQAVAETFLTLHGEQVVYPGIRHQHTADAISKMLGDHDVRVQTKSFSHTKAKEPSVTWGTNETVQRIPRVPPDQIASGVPDDPTMPLFIHPPGNHPNYRPYEYADSMPVWGQRPWPRLLISSMEFIARHASPHDPRRALLVPELDRRDREGAGIPYLWRQRDGRALLERYLVLREVFAASRAHQRQLAEDPSFRDPNCVDCQVLDIPEFDPSHFDDEEDLALHMRTMDHFERDRLDDESTRHKEAMAGLTGEELVAEMARHAEEVAKITEHFTKKRSEATT